MWYPWNLSKPDPSSTPPAQVPPIILGSLFRRKLPGSNCRWLSEYLGVPDALLAPVGLTYDVVTNIQHISRHAVVGRNEQSESGTKTMVSTKPEDIFSLNIFGKELSRTRTDDFRELFSPDFDRRTSIVVVKSSPFVVMRPMFEVWTIQGQGAWKISFSPATPFIEFG